MDLKTKMLKMEKILMSIYQSRMTFWKSEVDDLWWYRTEYKVKCCELSGIVHKFDLLPSF